MRKNFIQLNETVTAENLEELKELVGDTKVGYSLIILTRDLSQMGMPTYQVFTSSSVKAGQSLLEFLGQTGKTKITHTHVWDDSEPNKLR